MTHTPKKNNISVILARKGTGKSCLMQFLLLMNSKSSIIIDPTASLPPFKNRLSFENEKEFIQAMKNPETGLFKRFKNKKIDCVIETPQDLDAFLAYLVDIKLKNFLLVIDEIDLFYGATLPQNTALYRIINLGRHSEIDIIGVARRPANMPRPLTSQSDNIYIGNMNHEPNDEKYLKEFINIAEIPKLENYNFLNYNYAGNFQVLALDERSLKIMKII